MSLPVWEYPHRAADPELITQENPRASVKAITPHGSMLSAMQCAKCDALAVTVAPVTSAEDRKALDEYMEGDEEFPPERFNGLKCLECGRPEMEVVIVDGLDFRKPT